MIVPVPDALHVDEREAAGFRAKADIFLTQKELTKTKKVIPDNTRLASALHGLQSGFSDFSLRPLLWFHKTGRFLGQSNSKNLDI
jgi:hypothetical protein